MNFTGADVRNGMTAVVSIKHPDPRFEGQTKTKLDNQDAAKATAKVTGDEIQLFFDKNLETLKTVISCAEKKRQRSVRPRSAPRPICSPSRSFRLIPMESLQIVRAGTLPSVKSSSSREIPPEVPQRQRETEIIRQSCQSGVKS